MPYFRDAQNQAHPNKTNTLMLGIILMLIGIVSIQIWFLYSALNNALKDNLTIAVFAFFGSLLLFITSLLIIRFLPDPRGPISKRKRIS